MTMSLIKLQINNHRMFIAPCKWLILQDLTKNKKNSTVLTDYTVMDNSENKLKEVFGTLDVYPDSEVLIGQRLEENLINLISLYRPSPYRSLILEDLGAWNDQQGISLCNNAPTSRRRKNLMGTQLESCLVVRSTANNFILVNLINLIFVDDKSRYTQPSY